MMELYIYGDWKVVFKSAVCCWMCALRAVRHVKYFSALLMWVHLTDDSDSLSLFLSLSIFLFPGTNESSEEINLGHQIYIEHWFSMSDMHLVLLLKKRKENKKCLKLIPIYSAAVFVFDGALMTLHRSAVKSTVKVLCQTEKWQSFPLCSYNKMGFTALASQTQFTA